MKMSLGFGICVCLLSMGISWADCPQSGPAQFLLDADEFDVPGYDATRGLLAVRLPVKLRPNGQRARAIRFHRPDRDIYLQVSPEKLKLGLETGRSALELTVEGVPLEVAPALAKTPRCEDIVPNAIVLHRSGLVIARGAVGSQESPIDFVQVKTKVSVEKGRVNATEIVSLGRQLALRCARRMPDHGRGLRGAVSLQIETSIIGKPMRPKVVVDGLVNRPFTLCLASVLIDAQPLWRTLQPATRIYLNFYLRLNPLVTVPPTLSTGRATERPPARTVGSP